MRNPFLTVQDQCVPNERTLSQLGRFIDQGGEHVTVEHTDRFRGLLMDEQKYRARMTASRRFQQIFPPRNDEQISLEVPEFHVLSPAMSAKYARFRDTVLNDPDCPNPTAALKKIYRMLVKEDLGLM